MSLLGAAPTSIARTRTILLLLLSLCAPISIFGASNHKLRAKSNENGKIQDGNGRLALAQHEYRANLTNLLIQYPDYNQLVPGTDSVALELGLSMASIIELDVQNEIFTTSLQYNIKWEDPRLSWNSSEYGGIERIAFPPHRIWRPSILLKNSMDSQWDPTFPVLVSINHEGQANYDPPGIFRSSCLIDPTYFPFDNQICHFRVGLMADEGYRVDINPPATGTDLILRGYTRHQMWDIVNITISRSDSGISSLNNDNDYDDLTFWFTLRRRPKYYVWTLLVPVLLISYTLPLLLLIPMYSRERLICTFIFFELLPELLRYVVPHQVTSAGISIVGKYSLLMNALGFIILVETVLQAAFCGRRRAHAVHEHAHGSHSSGKALIRGEKENQEKIDATKSGLTRSPGALDIMLVLACYVVLTSWNLYTFFTLPWFYDARPHF